MCDLPQPIVVVVASEAAVSEYLDLGQRLSWKSMQESELLEI